MKQTIDAKSTNYKLQIAKHEEENRFNDMLEHLSEAKATLERALRDIDRNINRLNDACGVEATNTNPEEVFSWAINDIQNMLSNLRFDRAVTTASRYAIARARLEATKKAG